MRRTWLGLLAFALALTVALATSAQEQPSDATRAAAREVGERALAAYDQGRYEEALAGLERAHTLVPVPATALWQARALVKLGRLVAASERYLEAMRLPLGDQPLPANVRAKDEARTERDELLPRIPRLVVHIEGPVHYALFVTLDGRPMPLGLLGIEQPVDPGAHHLEARAGQATAAETVAIGPGQRRAVTLALRVPTAPPPQAAPRTEQPARSSSPARVAGWVGFSVGLAGIVAGAATGGAVLSKRSDLREACDDDNRCYPNDHDDVESYDKLRTGSTVCFVAGGVLTAAGLALVIAAPHFDPEEESPASAAIEASPAGLRATIAW